MPTICETLMKYTNEYLIELIFHLMDRLNEKERIEFISKHISAEIALEATGYNDNSSFLRKVSTFCKLTDVNWLDRVIFIFT
jgi:predicted metallopeptidase